MIKIHHQLDITKQYIFINNINIKFKKNNIKINQNFYEKKNHFFAKMIIKKK